MYLLPLSSLSPSNFWLPVDTGFALVQQVLLKNHIQISFIYEYTFSNIFSFLSWSLKLKDWSY